MCCLTALAARRVSQPASVSAVSFVTVRACYARQTGWTPLMQAVTYRLYDMTKYLVEEAHAPLEAKFNVRAPSDQSHVPVAHRSQWR